MICGPRRTHSKSSDTNVGFWLTGIPDLFFQTEACGKRYSSLVRMDSTFCALMMKIPPPRPRSWAKHVLLMTHLQLINRKTLRSVAPFIPRKSRVSCQRAPQTAAAKRKPKFTRRQIPRCSTPLPTNQSCWQRGRGVGFSTRKKCQQMTVKPCHSRPPRKSVKISAHTLRPAIALWLWCLKTLSTASNTSLRRTSRNKLVLLRLVFGCCFEFLSFHLCFLFGFFSSLPLT